VYIKKLLCVAPPANVLVLL